MKEQEHKREVEKLWLERLNAYRIEKEREQE
jgi:ribosomal protein L20